MVRKGKFVEYVNLFPPLNDLSTMQWSSIFVQVVVYNEKIRSIEILLPS